MQERTNFVLAFGIFARALPGTDEFKSLREKVGGIELADSITSDCHKMLNVVSTKTTSFSETQLIYRSHMIVVSFSHAQ